MGRENHTLPGTGAGQTSLDDLEGDDGDDQDDDLDEPPGE